MQKPKHFSYAIPADIRKLAKEYQTKALKRFDDNQKIIDEHIANKAVRKEQQKPIDLSEMTVQQVKELEKGPKLPAKNELEKFFEGMIGNKTAFLGHLLMVKNVFPRSTGIAVEFECPVSKIQLLVFAQREREKQGLKPHSIIKIEGKEVEIYGEVQLGINQKFKVLFPC